MSGSIDWVNRKVFVALGAILASSGVTEAFFTKMSILWNLTYILATQQGTYEGHEYEKADRGSVIEEMVDVLGFFAGDIIFGIIAIIAGGVMGFIIHAVIFRPMRP